MRLLNELFIIRSTTVCGETFDVTIELDPGHVVYKGHYPGHPVTPGVIQLQIVHELLEIQLKKDLRLQTITECKFLGVLDPEVIKQFNINIRYQEVDRLLHVNVFGSHGTDRIFKLSAIYSISAQQSLGWENNSAPGQ